MRRSPWWLAGRWRRGLRRQLDPQWRPAAFNLTLAWARARARHLILWASLLALLAATGAPFLSVRHPQVSGAHDLASGAVLGLAGAVSPSSVFAIDPARMSALIAKDVWVRAVTVSVRLPNRLLIDVTEWRPEAVWHQGGEAAYVDARGVDLGAAAAATSGLPLIDASGSAGPLPGARLIPPQLITILVNLDHSFRRLFPG